ncbi:ATP:corrinoid adenosyltransferase BtuR/CobO/CobP [Thermosinus carboxydivorans Nor1]|uniref:ATP:corrinoid adenosyltransferase BtuR/CobO/CobP n=1 Tax=Thermosinus carboxydivorans Nor1 TaxID=401526 RepID=A1HPW8_9FIRM|nr:cob(I)yrinic acid a,c-diamide adenosyltransferase [Thermosinus carboxydivorans]EAX47820.1 ATP:corrinoid adenosyltransferase BtuR/CobO/CobP [Thermosinus carboxydivorans Nor1]
MMGIALQKGKVYVYTGDGKGKTTAALGMGLRAAGNGERVVMVQFLKGTGYTGELFAAPNFDGRFILRQFGFGCPDAVEIRMGIKVCCKCGRCFRENRNPVHGFVDRAFEYAADVITAGAADMVILDEISHAVNRGLLPVAKVIKLISLRPEKMKLVLTGRKMPAEILNLADSITICQAVKHPMAQGIDARRGVEY